MEERMEKCMVKTCEKEQGAEQEAGQEAMDEPPAMERYRIVVRGSFETVLKIRAATPDDAVDRAMNSARYFLVRNKHRVKYSSVIVDSACFAPK